MKNILSFIHELTNGPSRGIVILKINHRSGDLGTADAAVLGLDRISGSHLQVQKIQRFGHAYLSNTFVNEEDPSSAMHHSALIHRKALVVVEGRPSLPVLPS